MGVPESYSIINDVDGNGGINFVDYFRVRFLTGQVLPPLNAVGATPVSPDKISTDDWILAVDKSFDEGRYAREEASAGHDWEDLMLAELTLIATDQSSRETVA